MTASDERIIGSVPGDAEPILAVDSMTVAFGGLKAVDEVTLDMPEGAVVGMIGPNGAGKTTFIDALTGFVPFEGTIVFDGERIDRLPAHQRARRGIGRTFQQLELFEDLTVRENLQVTAERPTWWAFLLDLLVPGRSTAQERVERAIQTLGLQTEAPQLPNQLSHGSRQAVSIGRALAAEPRVLVLDEPGAGLETAHKEILSDILRGLAHDDGMTIFLVDHDMDLVMPTCDHIFVLEFGKLIAQGTPAEIRTNPKVIEAYLGHSQEEET